jgi:signal transduction histidine kinase
VGAHRNLDNQISTNFQRLEKRVQQLKKEKRALNEKMNTIELEKAKAVHDLKTPLTSIFGFGVLLKNELDSEEVDEKNLSRYSEKILKNTQRLEMLINEVLENEDDADGQIEVISIKDCIDEIRNELSFRISKKNILLNLCELPEIRIIKMDLLKILRNIISNSVKYNDPDKDGEIRIYHERPDNSRLHYIIIEDNGIGICQENIDTVLQPYNREERCDIKGSGIGLSICREVMEKYCGELGIKSRAGSGTAVKLGFPSELFVTV